MGRPQRDRFGGFVSARLFSAAVASHDLSAGSVADLGVTWPPRPERPPLIPNRTGRPPFASYNNALFRDPSSGVPGVPLWAY